MTFRNIASVLLIIMNQFFILTILLAGGGSEPSISVPVEASADDLLVEPGSYESSGVEYASETGLLIVAENRDDPSTALIALPIVRISSAANRPAEPIFVITGGSGISNMGLGQVSWYHQNHDIVLVGFRGVDGSVFLDCPEYGIDFMRGFKGDTLSSEGIAGMIEAYRLCSERLIDEGIDLDGYTAD